MATLVPDLNRAVRPQMLNIKGPAEFAAKLVTTTFFPTVAQPIGFERAYKDLNVVERDAVPLRGVKEDQQFKPKT